MTKTKLLIFPMLVMLMITLPTSFAEEDEFEDDERQGFGIMEREREREHQDEGIPIDTGMGSIILYGTLVAIGVSVAYTAYKMMSSKRKSTQKPQ